MRKEAQSETSSSRLSPFSFPAGLPDEVREVAEGLAELLPDVLTAVYWHGSYARGEAKPDSDHDMIIVLRQIDDDVLMRLRGVFRGRADWSTFVQSEEELRQYPLDGRLQFAYGLVPLYGRLEPPPLEDAANELRVLCRDIRFECRYRLLHSEPLYSEEEQRAPGFQARRNARMLRYAAKLAVLALKARELLRGRSYPVTREELRSRLYFASDEVWVLDVLEQWEAKHRKRYEKDPVELALKLDALARKLVAELEEGKEK